MTKNFFRFCAAAFFAGAGLAVANTADAQEVTITLTAEPSSLVSLSADGYLIYKGTQAGTMTATVFAVTGTLESGTFTPRHVNATGMAFVTLRGLDSCSIASGCAAFGLEGIPSGISGADARLASLFAMDLATVTMFAASGADLNELVGGTGADDFLVYHLATANKPAHLSVFVNAGASLEAKDNREYTPLIFAADHNNITAITVLLSAGASVNVANNNGNTPLLIAVRRDNITAITALLSVGASVNVISDTGFSPLMRAAAGGNITAITALLSAGASINVTDNRGDTPLDRAISRNLTEAIVVLIANGGLCRASNTDSRCPGAGSPIVGFGTANLNRTFVKRSSSLTAGGRIAMVVVSSP